MVTKATSDLFWGHAACLIDPYGTFPVSDIGYIEEAGGVTVKYGHEVGFDRVAELDGDVISKTLGRSVMLDLKLKQFLPEVFARACGIGYNSGDFEVVVGGELIDSPELACQIIGTRRDGSPFHLYLPRAVASEEVQLDFKKKDPMSLPLSLKAMDGTHKLAKAFWGRGVTTGTIATGSVGRTQAATANGITWLKLAGEGAAADTLDDITSGSGASLTDGERIRIQIQAAAQPITINHNSGVIELKTAADWVMTHLTDWLDLYYDLANTTWKEIARYDQV